MSNVDANLRELARDPGLARSLRRSLGRLADGVGGPELQEMARDVLAGRISLREAAGSHAYAAALREHSSDKLDKLLALPAEEREALAERGRAELAELRAEAEADQAAEDH
jgi:hypothetical protein